MEQAELQAQPVAGNHVAADPAYPPALREVEAGLIRQRPDRAESNPKDWVGVGLSGGGIRSATFCLGVFQAFGKLGLLKKIDYASSVSGGGYFTSFYGRLFTRAEVTGLDQVVGILAANETEPANAGTGNWMRKTFRWLRENGRYLAPHGAGDLLSDLTVVLRNWLSLQVVIAMFVLMLLMIPQLIRNGIPWPALITWIKQVSWIKSGLLDNIISFLTPNQANFPWSPYIVIPFVIVVVAAIPLGWAYWLVASLRTLPPSGWPWLAPVLLVATPIVGRLGFRPMPPAAQIILAAVAALTLVVAGVAINLARIKNPRPQMAPQPVLPAAAPPSGAKSYDAFDIKVYDTAASQLSQYLKNTLVIASAILGFALIDSVGQAIHLKRLTRGTEAVLGPPLAIALAVAPFIKWLAGNLLPPGKTTHVHLPLGLLAALGAAVIIIPALCLLDAASYYAVNAGAAFGALLVLSLIAGRMRGFLNFSTLAYLYGSRLVRAYLGASNPERLSNHGPAVSDAMPGDDIVQEEYWSPQLTRNYQKGAPLHLVNVTLNETYGGRGEVEQRDRKGRGMAIGPAGISAGVSDHVVFNSHPQRGDPANIYNDVQVFPSDPNVPRAFDYSSGIYRGQRLALGSWTGISGAAASTGLGSRSSLGLSLLAGFFNVRLGYWWDSGVAPKRRRTRASVVIGRFFRLFFPVQRQLLNEFLSRFPGTSERYWYLTDGGHFENMGGYELIRRRLPLIVIIDAELDANYTFSGLAGLVQKARLDFSAQIEFLSSAELDKRLVKRLDQTRHPMRDLFGTLDQLRRGTWAKEPVNDPATRAKRLSLAPPDIASLSLAHAALARITYSDGTCGELIVLKPTLTGDEPADVLHYHGAHPAFPHESTADQFFDEAQWESYRKLGEHIATKLFEYNDVNGPFRTFSR